MAWGWGNYEMISVFLYVLSFARGEKKKKTKFFHFRFLPRKNKLEIGFPFPFFLSFFIYFVWFRLKMIFWHVQTVLPLKWLIWKRGEHAVAAWTYPRFTNCHCHLLSMCFKQKGIRTRTGIGACGIFVCPNKGMAASVWDSKRAHRYECMPLHTGAVRTP